MLCATMRRKKASDSTPANMGGCGEEPLLDCTLAGGRGNGVVSMRNIQLEGSGVAVPTIAVGCMRIVGLDVKRAEHFLKTTLENGANFFDHADCYSGGSSLRCQQDYHGLSVASASSGPHSACYGHHVREGS